MAFVRLEADCGSPIFIERSKDDAGVAISVYVRVGSADESPEENGMACGIAHALEHMVFEKTEMFGTIKELAARIEDVGGEIGAGTDQVGTNFWVHVPKISVRRAVQVLHQMMTKPIFGDAIAEETKVVIQELREYQDKPESAVEDLFYETLFPNHPLGRPIVGTANHLPQFSTANLRRFYRKFYRPKNWAFVVSGAITARTIKRIINEHFTEKDPKADDGLKLFPPLPKPNPVLRVTERRDIENAYVMIGAGFPDANKKNGIIARVFAVMLDGTSRIDASGGQGFSFPLTEAFRTRSGLTYALGAEECIFRNIGVFQLHFNPPPTRLEEGLGTMRDVIEAVKNDAALLKRAKRALTYHNNLWTTSLKDDVEIAGDEIGNFGRPITTEEENAAIRSVGIWEIRKFVDEHLNPEKLVTAVIKPPSIEDLSPLD